MAKVLVAGVYMADKPNTAPHLMFQFASPSNHQVTQRWICLTDGTANPTILPNTVEVTFQRTPKFKLLNRLLTDREAFDWVLLCDDDIEVAPGFVDTFIDAVEQYDLVLAQPSRTADSYVDHDLVRHMPGITARRTRFVEIGPLTCIGRPAYPLLFPFAENAGMGWGLDFIWPVLIEGAGLRMGIVDAAPVAHRLRPSADSYSYHAEYRAMSWALARHPHLTYDDALTIVEAFP